MLTITGSFSTFLYFFPVVPALLVSFILILFLFSSPCDCSFSFFFISKFSALSETGQTLMFFVEHQQIVALGVIKPISTHVFCL